MKARNAPLLAIVVILASASSCFGNSCEAKTLPVHVRLRLEKEFHGWEMVTTRLLSSADDRKIWEELYSNECPGMIRGRFTGDGVEYVVNLLAGTGESLEQQIVLFKRNGSTLVLDPPSHVDVVTVLRKFGPGVYRSRDVGTSVNIRHDTIGVSEIEGGTVVYYWDGKHFQSIVTSE